MTLRIVLLHPGAMGSSVGAAARVGGATVVWAGEGRSPATAARATAAGLEDAGSLAAALDGAGAVVSVCPPDAAVEAAEAVAAHGFAGIYVDANAVSPATAARVAQAVTGSATYVDGGIVGGPAWRPGTTRLYLSGADAEVVAAWFAAGPLEAVAIGEDPTAASALKMAYAAWTKGSGALLLAVRALAAATGVEEALLAEWRRSQPDLPADAGAARAAPKAWRFAGEMREIADTFSAANLPVGFHRAAAEVFERLAGFKDADAPATGEVLSALLGRGDAAGSGDRTRTRR